MARPPKTGLNYFPLNVEFFDDPKVSAVIIEHGLKGQAAVIMLLCAIYRNGYYMEWTPENYITVLRQLPGISISKMQKIVKTLVEWDFFDRNIFEQYHVLTSHGIQQRYLNAARRRKQVADSPSCYWLEKSDDNDNDDETDSSSDKDTNMGVDENVATRVRKAEKVVVKVKKEATTTKGDEDKNVIEEDKLKSETEKLHATTPQDSTKDTGDNTELMHAETSKMTAETTQEDNKKIIINYHYPPSTPTHTREAVEKLKNNKSWMEVVCMRHKLSLEQLEQHLEEFALDCECRGKQTHESITDAQSHFCNWLIITQKHVLAQSEHKTARMDNNNAKDSLFTSVQNQHYTSAYNNYYTPAYNHHTSAYSNKRTSADYIEDAKQWAIERSIQFLQSANDEKTEVQGILPF